MQIPTFTQSMYCKFISEHEWTIVLIKLCVVMENFVENYLSIFNDKRNHFQFTDFKFGFSVKVMNNLLSSSLKNPSLKKKLFYITDCQSKHNLKIF